MYIELWRSIEVFQYVPLSNRRSALRKHFVPVFNFHRTALRTKNNLTNSLVAAHPIIVHDTHNKTRLSDALVRNGKCERFVEVRIQRLLLDLGLFLLHLLAFECQPYLNVWICNIQFNGVR